MWLLDTLTFELIWVADPEQEHYAILSHVWHPEGELTFQEVREMYPQSGDTTPHSRASRRSIRDRWTTRTTAAHAEHKLQKLRAFCALAHSNGHTRAWMDTCCIDKTRPAELADALNSMHAWYAAAAICYVLLPDVSASEDPRLPFSAFRRSVWFTRSWTLQELLAPPTVVFLSYRWEVLGTKASLADLLQDITDIPTGVLLHETPLDIISVARRLSWVAPRRATLVEDEAYALMGLFGVHIPVLYGEGTQAFLRLQHAILAHTGDQSIFAWGGILEWENITHAYWERPSQSAAAASHERPSPTLFADRPVHFSRCSGIVSAGSFSRLAERTGIAASGSDGALQPTMTLTNHGMHTQLPMLCFRVYDRRDRISRVYYLGLLACEDHEGRVLSLVMTREPRTAEHDAREFSVDQLWQFRTLYRDWQVRVVALPDSVIATDVAPIGVSDSDTKTQD
ncbi:hypothetical protein C8Q80DRAFT_1275160 [Daedaleopsis nitida]|nr:hypothetical protein C8Q80DRAFT_1275160 [Daedaleopsis nitida]